MDMCLITNKSSLNLQDLQKESTLLLDRLCVSLSHLTTLTFTT
jgi:hypothetical protein